MAGRHDDPIEHAADETVDLYDVASWEARSRTDRLAVTIHRAGIGSAKLLVVLLAVLILVGIGGLTAIVQPAIGFLTVLSVIPAVLLAAYVWWSDVTAPEPPTLLVATFLLGVLLAGFAAIVNTVTQPLFASLGFLGAALFFFLIVGPVEETVKLLAVRLYAYNDDRFDAVVDGAIYGAVAGLGFATIENSLFIARSLAETGMLTIGFDLLDAGGGITATRALAGPAHVVLSAYAGYYLGLAKFNPDNRGPIIVKGLLVAALVHGAYNTLVGPGTALIQALTSLPQLAAFFVFVLVYLGAFGFVLFRKIERYRRVYRAAGAGRQRPPAVVMQPAPAGDGDDGPTN